MITFLTVVHIAVCLFLILVVLLARFISGLMVGVHPNASVRRLARPR